MDGLPLTWWLYFPSERAAGEAGRVLAAADYLIAVDRAHDVQVASAASTVSAGQWLLRAAKPLAPGSYEAELERMERLAGRYGGLFDGWETGLVDDIPQALIELGQGHLLEEIDGEE